MAEKAMLMVELRASDMHNISITTMTSMGSYLLLLICFVAARSWLVLRAHS